MITIVGALWLIVTVSFVGLHIAIHRVQDGYVAVYYRGGALMSTVASPGIHIMIPLVTNFRPVQVTLQTDVVKHVPCGTSGGVVVYFDRIEVMNMLAATDVYSIVKNYTTDYDKTLILNKVHHKVRQFCSSHSLQEVYIDMFDTIDEHLKQALQDDLNVIAPGLNIRSVHVTKPKIPEAIRHSYEQVEVQKAKLLAAIEHQKVVQTNAQTERSLAVIEAEKIAHIASIHHEQTVKEKETLINMSRLDNEALLVRQRAQADAHLYTTAKTAEANALLLTNEYLELKRIEAIGTNNKNFHDNQIPKGSIHGDTVDNTRFTTQ